MDEPRELRLPEGDVLEAFSAATPLPMPESDENAYTMLEWAKAEGVSVRTMRERVRAGVEAGRVKQVKIWRRDAVGRRLPVMGYKLAEGEKPGDGGG